MVAKTKTVFFRDCETLVCPECQTRTAIESLSELSKLESVEKQITAEPRIQFSLTKLLLLFLPFAILAWIVDFIGLDLVLSLTLPLAGFFGYLIFAVLAAWVVHNVPKWRNAIWDSFREPGEINTRNRE